MNYIEFILKTKTLFYFQHNFYFNHIFGLLKILFFDYEIFSNHNQESSFVVTSNDYLMKNADLIICPKLAKNDPAEKDPPLSIVYLSS